MKDHNPGILFKADSEKAYDHVNWGFIKWVLSQMGFCITLIRWILICITSLSVSILINGEVKGFSRGGRGIRQGDPLSPFLFTIVMQVLSLMLDKAAGHKVISGFKVQPPGISVTHLQFADDTLFFLGTNMTEVQMMKDILMAFELCYGLHINFSPVGGLTEITNIGKQQE